MEADSPVGGKSNSQQKLRSGSPNDILEKYKQRHSDERPRSFQSRDSAWGQFTRWCTEVEGISSLHNLGPYFATDFQDWLRANESIHQNEYSLKQTLLRVRKVIKFAQSRGYVPVDVPHDWDIPDADSPVREDTLPADLGVKIMHNLEQHAEYSRFHALWLLVFRYGLRASAIRAVGINDVSLDRSNGFPPHIHVRDRPFASQNHGLPLKNTNDMLATRRIPLDEYAVDVLDSYIFRNRDERVGTDEAGEQGLFTTERSPRISQSCIQNWVHAVTSPVIYSGACSCDGCQAYHSDHGTFAPASKLEQVCDETYSPHECRHGAITNMLNDGKSHQAVANVVGTSPDTIRDTYDQSDEWDRLRRTNDAWYGN